MIFNFDKKEHDKIIPLLDAKEINISSVEILKDYLENNYDTISDSNILKNLSDEEKIKMFYDKFIEVENLDTKNKDFIELEKITRFNQIELLSSNEYVDNPYLKIIKDIKFKNDEWELRDLYYEAYEGFVYDEIIIDNNNYAEHTPFGFFKTKYNYPAIIEKDEIWMSLIPHEINTMNKAIKKAHGKVLIYGLGLGYFAYMASRKDDVKEIIIVEKDDKIINLFNTYLLTHFEQKNKIKIICEDAISYAKNASDYDYVFCDIYHNVHDGLPLYLKMKALEKDNIKYDYWIETSLIAMVRRYILTIYEEAYYYGYIESDYLNESSIEDKIINSLYRFLENYQFNSYQEFHDFLSDESLIALVKNLNYK